MSVFYHNDDPLLHHTMFQQPMQSNNLSDTYAQMYKQQLIQEMQQNNQIKDWVGELDNLLKGLDNSTVELLNKDTEFTMLNTQLQSLIQQEIMLLVKPKINSNNGVIENINKQIDIVNRINQEVKNEEKRNMNELNDYLKNYSHLTFDDYKRIKEGGINVSNGETVVTMNNEKNNKRVKTKNI